MPNVFAHRGRAIDDRLNAITDYSTVSCAATVSRYSIALLETSNFLVIDSIKTSTGMLLSPVFSRYSSITFYITQKDDGMWRIDGEASNLPMITIEV
jgi:hypothetical protein